MGVLLDWRSVRKGLLGRGAFSFALRLREQESFREWEEGEGKAKVRRGRGRGLGLEEVPLVMVDRLVVEFTKSDGHFISSIVGKEVLGIGGLLDWRSVWKCFWGRGFQMRKTHGGGWDWELKFRVCL